MLAVALALPLVACVDASTRRLAPRQLPSAPCAVPGKAIQWIGDYCLFKEQTDDLIAAGDCMARERARSGTGDGCTVVTRYKSELCKLHLSAGLRQGTLADCVNDTAFSGNIVRNDGSP